MKRAPAVFALLVALLTASSAAAVEKLYFADNGEDKILRCNLDGTNIEELVTTDIEVVGNIAIDRVGGKMYWTDWSGTQAHIKRADLDGSNDEILLTGLGGPWGIDLDVSGGKMYWTEFSVKKIRRANLDGSNVEDLVTTGLSHPSGIALDLAGGKMYWGDGASEYTGKMMRANLDGSNVEILINDPVIAPQGMDIDLTAGKMYWADLGTDSWYRSNLDGTGIEEILLSAYGTPTSVALDLNTSKMYVTEYGGSDSEIKRANLDGTGVEILIDSGIGACYGLTIGPATADCSNASMQDVWMVIITGVETYDYSVWLIFDGLGTITEMGAFSVPYPAGTYDIEPHCDMSGTIWTDGYVPFIGQVLSDTTAEMDVGGGMYDVFKVTDPGALEGCWAGTFTQDATDTTWYVGLTIDENGDIVSSSGFPGAVTGKIYTVAGYLAGLISAVGPIAPEWQIMFQDASTDVVSLMSGTFDMDCSEPCSGGTFYLTRCSVTGVGDDAPEHSLVSVRNYPNPFNPRTTIALKVPAEGPVSLAIYDVSGRLVRSLLHNHIVRGGRTEIPWDGRDERGRQLSSGAYFYRLEVGGNVITDRMTLLK